MDEKILERVRALLAKAESTTPGEAEALTAKAAELMARYGIDRCMADTRENKNMQPASVIILAEAPYALPKVLLLSAVARGFNCQTVKIYGGRKNKANQRVHVFGFQSDLDLVQMLYTSLLLQAANAAQYEEGYDSGHTRRLRHSFICGFAAAVGERLQAANAKAKDEAEGSGIPGTALVLRDRSLAVQDAKAKVYPTLKKFNVSYSSESGYNAGDNAGRRANLHDRRETTGATRGALT